MNKQTTSAAQAALHELQMRGVRPRVPQIIPPHPTNAPSCPMQSGLKGEIMHITTFHLLMAAYHTISAYPPHRAKLRAEFERAIEIANAGRSPIHAASLAVELTNRIADGAIELIDDELRSLAVEGFMEVGDEWLCDVLHAAWSAR